MTVLFQEPFHVSFWSVSDSEAASGLWRTLRRLRQDSERCRQGMDATNPRGEEKKDLN